MNTAESLISKFNFIPIGTYKSINSIPILEVVEGIKKSERKNLVYMMVVDNEIKYIGKTVQGYKRPLGYHKNNVMKEVKNGIFETAKKGLDTRIFICEPEVIKYKGLDLVIIESLEQALIKTINPLELWNNYISK